MFADLFYSHLSPWTLAMTAVVFCIFPVCTLLVSAVLCERTRE